ncbi:hypothetical protein [Priestia abyssalis]|uniref:hypothetical protein n=1 Tax=Priestia abyssalis TaxID=1221450 RepID=UPI000995AA14|nr:hypothetical protein [Priestia abyssalis]
MSGEQLTLFYLLSFFIPVVGIVWMNDVDLDKKSVRKNCLLITIIPLVFSCICWFALSAFSLIPTYSGYYTLLEA